MAEELALVLDTESPYNFCEFDNMVIVVWRTNERKMRAYLKAKEEEYD